MSVVNTGANGTSVESVKKERKPRFLSWKWFKWIGSALKVWEYDEKNWAVWQVSSYATHAMWLTAIGGGKVIVALWSKLPVGLTKVVEFIWIKVVAFITAVWHVVTGQ